MPTPEPFQAAPRPLRVLLLEDEEPDVSVVREFLSRSERPEFLLTVASLVSEAVERVQAEPPDIVVCDLHLPDDHGMSVLQRLRSVAPSVPLVVLTGAMPSHGVEAVRAGASAFLVKEGLESSDLVQAVLYTHLREHAHFKVRNLIALSADGIFVLDSENKVRFLNPAGEHLLGRPAADLLGEELLLSFSNETRLEIVRPDGSVRHVDVRVTPTPWEDEQATMLTLRDITEQVNLELRLQRAARLEAIGRLAGGVAHDFNNMLTTIMGSTQILARSFDPHDPRRKHLEAIKLASERSAELTRRLLAFGRRQVLQPIVADLNEVVREADSLLVRLIEPMIRVTYRFTEQPVEAVVDPGQLQQALVNLASNAVLAMPQGGNLELSVSLVDQEDLPQGVRAELQEPVYAQVSMRDTGHGMSAETLALIFEPFFTTRALGEGTGLGLASVHGFVRQSQGQITCTSEPGVGTQFAIFLPLAREVSSQEVLVEAPIDRTGAETILLVEDEELVLTLLNDVLDFQGYTVISADSGSEALKVLKGPSGGAVDLVLTDVSMPGMSGTELVQEARVLFPELRVVFMSGFSEERLDSGSRPSSCAFLQKPFSPSDVTRVVREALDS